MKKLQNNFTTPEQSKRLLELGVPADSADLILIREKSEDMQFYDYEFEKQVLNFDEKFSDWDTFEWHRTHHILPCWSVGRLMEICYICGSYKLSTAIYGRAILYRNTINGIISEMAYEIGHIDFSKLEE